VFQFEDLRQIGIWLKAIVLFTEYTNEPERSKWGRSTRVVFLSLMVAGLIAVAAGFHLARDLKNLDLKSVAESPEFNPILIEMERQFVNALRKRDPEVPRP
jgi:hypothetical protein